MSDAPPPNTKSTLAPPLAQSESAAATNARTQGAGRDVVLLGPPTADGGVHVIRARDERIEAGELRALQEGRPIVGEVLTLKPREGSPRICDVTDSYTPPSTAAPSLGHKGPAKVATEAYRAGWEEIFGAKRSKPEAAN